MNTVIPRPSCHFETPLVISSLSRNLIFQPKTKDGGDLEVFAGYEEAEAEVVLVRSRVSTTESV